MYTEDDIGHELRAGTMTVDQAVTLFQGDDVVVYPPVGVQEGTEMWADVEDMGAGSTVFHDLTTAGASPEQMDEIGANIVRLQMEGRTLDKVYGWSVEATTPEGTPVQPAVPDNSSLPAEPAT